MNIILRAAMMAVSLGTIGPAYAGDGAVAANTLEVPGVIAQAPVQNVPSIDTTQPGQTLRADTDRGSWLFPPIGKYLDQHAGG